MLRIEQALLAGVGLHPPFGIWAPHGDRAPWLQHPFKSDIQIGDLAIPASARKIIAIAEFIASAQTSSAAKASQTSKTVSGFLAGMLLLGQIILSKMTAPTA